MKNSETVEEPRIEDFSPIMNDILNELTIEKPPGKSKWEEFKPEEVTTKVKIRNHQRHSME